MALLIVILLALAAPAAGDAVDDYRAIHHDWEKDGQVMPCYWTQAQLENAHAVSETNPDDQYNDFPDKVEDEIARWRRGDCDKPVRLRIVAVEARRERVRIENRTGRPVALGGMRLRDRQGHALKLRGTITDEVVVRSGRRAVWDDRGDIARLIDADGRVRSQYGYGRFRSAKRF